MSSASTTRRAVAEIDLSGSHSGGFRIGNRSIHGFWHLFSSHFRHVLVAPQRRPESGGVAWAWREEGDPRPVTAAELAEVRRRLSESSRSLGGSLGVIGGEDAPAGGSAATLECQVLAVINQMVGQLVSQRDAALARFVCRTETGIMVHSWGCVEAAKPVYPDGRNGEISGTVFSANGRPLAAEVILENPTGVRVSRTESHKERGFRFTDIPAGSYRLRVADRSDFAGEGLAITLDQGALKRLELRADGAPTNPGQAKTQGGRGVPLAVALFLILGAGAAAWLLIGPADGHAPGGSPSGGWRSASGSLVDSGGHDKDTAHRSLHSRFKWPSLARISRAFRSAFTQGTRSPAGTAGIAGDNERRADGAEASADGRALPAPGERVAGEPADQQKAPPDRAPGAKKGASEKPDSIGPDTGPSESSLDPSAPPPSKEIIRAVPIETARADGMQPDAAAAASPSLGAAPEALSQAADAGGDGAEATGSVAAGGSSDGLPSPGNGTSAGPLSGTEGAGGAKPAALPSQSVIVANPAEGAVEKAQSEIEPLSALPDKLDAKQDSMQATAAAQPGPETAKDAPHQEHNEPRRLAIPTPHSAEKTAPRAAPVATASLHPLPPTTVADPVASAGASTPGRDLDAVAGEQRGAKQGAAALAAVAPSAEPVLSGPNRPLVRIGRLHATPWKAQVVRDIIVPTRPVPVTAGESVASLQDGLRRERLALMPRSFAQPRVRCGLAFEFSPDSSGPPKWRVSGGSVPGSTVDGNRAELDLPRPGSLRDETYVLCGGDGRDIARVSFDRAGEPELRVTHGARAWYWLGVEREPSDGPYEWQLLSGGSLPGAWRQEGALQGGRMQRLEVPLASSDGMGEPTRVALVDPATGLGVAFEFALR